MLQKCFHSFTVNRISKCNNQCPNLSVATFEKSEYSVFLLLCRKQVPVGKCQPVGQEDLTTWTVKRLFDHQVLHVSQPQDHDLLLPFASCKHITIK